MPVAIKPWLNASRKIAKPALARCWSWAVPAAACGAGVTENPVRLRAQVTDLLTARHLRRRSGLHLAGRAGSRCMVNGSACRKTLRLRADAELVAPIESPCRKNITQALVWAYGSGGEACRCYYGHPSRHSASP